MNTGADSAIEARESGVHVVDYLKSRGYVQDISDEPNLRKAFDDGIVTAYIGFDPTARSLHIGNQLGIMLLAVLQRFGHQPVALGGGGTALVGDPSGRTSVRDVLSEEQIRQNLRSILPQFDRFLDFKGNRFGSNPPALLMNNADWLLELNYIEFLRDIGRHFSVNEMLAAETYKVRVDTGAGLNFVEFNYRIVQAYDFLHLYRTTGCRLQMGGSDQWGNIVAGVDLIRRVEGVQAFALVSPLITAASGEKLGKSAGNSVWLEGSMTSAFDYYQYWINVDDADVERLLKLFTFVSDEEIAQLTSVSGDALRDAKRVLAREVTSLAHGAQAAQEADASAQALFGSDSLEAMLADPNVPSAVIPGDLLANGITIAEAFIEAGLVASRGEARRLASQGGLSINGERIEEVDAAFTASGTPQLFRVGKKRYKRVHS
ncbi:MAG: tyrosine--tRNA ligase [Thermomicrobiales bacterium]|jgi:tyrosyl-tRNA synthetase|nr:tyrosine--tRNA ligase [Thermomicrobiales bacterium]